MVKGVGAILSVMVSAHAVQAQPFEADAVPASPPAPTERYWYGWQTLAALATSTVVEIGAAGLHRSEAEQVAGPIGVLAAVSFVLDGPIVHFANHNVAKGFGALALNVAMPIGVALVGAGIECAAGCHGPYGGLGGAALGFVVGAGGALVIDIAALAWGERRRGNDPAPVRRWVPSVGVHDKGATFGIAGTL